MKETKKERKEKSKSNSVKRIQVTTKLNVLSQFVSATLPTNDTNSGWRRQKKRVRNQHLMLVATATDINNNNNNNRWYMINIEPEETEL